MKLVTAEEMKEIERRAEEDSDSPVTTSELMINAGNSVFGEIIAQERFEPSDEQDTELDEGTVVVLAGSGNNGGDALVTAALLRQQFPDCDIKIYFYKRPRPRVGDGFPSKLTYTEAEEQDGVELDGDDEAFEELEADLYQAALVVDGLLGAGLTRPVEGRLADVIQLVNEMHQERRFDLEPLFTVAIDVPSGLDSDTGEVRGVALQADLTVTLGYPKRGLFAYDAAEYAGRIVLGDIGLPADLVAKIEEESADLRLTTSDWVRRHLPQRPVTAHKGTFGKLLVLSGSANYLGAPYLCTGSAMRTGAGLVTLAAPQNIINIIATKLSENTFLELPEVQSDEQAGQVAQTLAKQVKENKYRTMLIGPGLGQDDNKAALLLHILEWSQQSGFEWPRLVIDADGLNLLAKIPDWYKQLPAGNILTPHPAELGRLRNQSVAEIEADRYKSAREAARQFQQVVILKGAYTVVAAPDGRMRLNPGSNPAMATAGSGDVLAGIAAGLLAQSSANQNLDTFEVACLAVYLHSMAGELVRRDLGDMGPVAGDFVTSIPQAVVAIKNGDSLE